MNKFKIIVLSIILLVLFNGCTFKEIKLDKAKEWGLNILGSLSLKKVRSEETQIRNNLVYLVNESKPYSGKIVDKYSNGSYK